MRMVEMRDMMLKALVVGRIDVRVKDECGSECLEWGSWCVHESFIPARDNEGRPRTHPRLLQQRYLGSTMVEIRLAQLREIRSRSPLHGNAPPQLFPRPPNGGCGRMTLQ